MKILGVLLILFGLTDFIGSYAGLDVWTDWFGIQLPEVIWRFSAWIEIGLGYLLLKAGSGNEAASQEAE
ncbi:MAG TPA: hypothetical protein ENJ01_11135 [Gammaproteobacteria bacterium]|nr:hypothetical protein [Gammaproteobacteria bacterium]